MTLKEFENKIKDKYEVTKMSTTNQYIFRLGSNGTVILQYHNNEFTKMHIAGKNKEEIEKTLLNTKRR